MISQSPERTYLSLSVLPLFALDILFTLIGQPSNYWSGQRHECIEQNPIGAWLLQIHPAAFIASAIVYAALFTAAILLLPRRIAWWISVGLLLAHSHGVRTWLWRLAPQFSFWEVVVNTLAAAWAAFCYLNAQAKDPKSQPPKAP
jgi:hypothetical protein